LSRLPYVIAARAAVASNAAQSSSIMLLTARVVKLVYTAGLKAIRLSKNCL